MVKEFKVSLYVRHHTTLKYKKAKPKFGHDSTVGYGFPPGTIFVLRYEQDGKRHGIWHCPEHYRMSLEGRLQKCSK